MSATCRSAVFSLGVAVVGMWLVGCGGSDGAGGTTGPTATGKACSSSSPQSFTAGQVSAGIGGTGICLGGGSTGADFALIGFYGNPDSSQVQPLTVTSTNATAITTADVLPTAIATMNLAPARLARARSNALQDAFEAKLHASERALLTPKFAAARAWYRNSKSASGALRDAIPSTVAVGQIITLNANSDNATACNVGSAINIAARVVAIGTSSIVVADTMNPLPTFSDSQYAAFAAMFDTLINPLDVSNFGQPTDIDSNNRIVMFFTKEVNKLTPRNSQGLIGGFFDGRDLFPTTANAFADACPASNAGEMFYLLVPDQSGVFSNPLQAQDVLDMTPPTLAHEYQHLINAGRRIYVNNASAYEVDWLNEGLSHIAEELLYYKVAGLSPRQNINIAALTGSSASVTAFNNNQADNFGRYQLFLGKPSQTSVFSASAGTLLEARGADWNMLRYLADHHGNGGSDTATWMSLVNTTSIGQQNLAKVFGTNYLTQIRDWATSVFSDDVAGVSDTRFEEPSWNMRDIFPRLVNQSGTPLNVFPLQVFPLADAAPVTTTVLAGGAAYVRFHVAAGASASIDWSASGSPVSSLMQFTVVRSK